ncbi:MAG: sulfite exporter TauE/SafE family protein, partial [Myxococcales bacterium]
MTALFGVLVGLSLGLTGGGGSVLALPLLIYGLGFSPRHAVAVSLVTVSATAAFGAIGAARAKLVEYRAGSVFGVGGVLAAPVGVRLSQLVQEQSIVTAFAVLMVVVALLMWRKAIDEPAQAAVVRADFVPGDAGVGGAVCRLSPDQRLRLNAPCTAALAVSGLSTGILSGLFGVGGGFVIVPALTLVTQLDIHRAVATSLFVIAIVSLSAVGSVLA